MEDSAQKDLQALLELVAAGFYSPKFNQEIPEELKKYDLAKLPQLLEDIQKLRTFQSELSQGQLNTSLQAKGFMSGTLKTLQTALRHINWQLDLLSRLDFSNKVAYLGDFSDSFNHMSETLQNFLSEIEASKDKFERLSTIDELTSLYNRRAFYEFAKKEISKGQRFEKSISFVMIDIDLFKSVNDTHGHKAGDVVLKQVALILQRNIREWDIAARLGGEEFVLLLTECSEGQASQVAERLRKDVEAHSFLVGELNLKVTVSIGIATASLSLDMPYDNLAIIEKFLALADKALYYSKKHGRNRSTLYSNKQLHLIR